MVRPSPILAARLRLTTKQVNGGYYKGNRTGSMGAHTQWGGYVVDFRKTRNFNCPSEENEKLTPFVSKLVQPIDSQSNHRGSDWDISPIRDGRAFVEAWQASNPDEFYWLMGEWELYLQKIGQLPEPKVPTPNNEPPTVKKTVAKRQRIRRSLTERRRQTKS